MSPVTRSQEPLLLLPGLLCDHRIWTDQIVALQQDRTIVVADYGSADSLSEMADRVLKVMPRGCAVAGHSMGARVALELWRTAPERFVRLALLDTGVHAPNSEEARKRYALLALGRKAGIDALTDAWLPPMVAPHNRVDPLMRRLREMVRAAGTDRFEVQIRALLGRPEVASLLGSITVPTLVGVGRLDIWSPPAQVRALAQQITGSRYVEFDGAGHMAPAEAPAAVTQALRGWLSA
ncbi:Pimeloyl-ACP methyl ester carboxylesterase [Sphingobium sp. AP50]|uniref:alpha/beta fold hydrolase n=1 Tax=Sphingobium sp. AP50 TaxID=1884369 RepID=UPI0008B5FBFF|nr:alpha/beta fold hydrolase [Sphingobium sp. AP50]SEK00262.1 Pimeloyl-ACP methyl ester carboxylesterase [Sphingobium sp. AP50]